MTFHHAAPSEMMRPLAGRLSIPTRCQAVLFDMDGVLIDSLGQDCVLVDALLETQREGVRPVPRELVREHFALALDDFWSALGQALGLDLSPREITELVARHEEHRRRLPPVVLEGVAEILGAVRRAGLQIAVVSNNPRADVEQMLSAARLLDLVDEVVGNDQPGLARKPAPDPYLHAASRLGLPAGECVAVEDSVLGLEAAHRAGCHAIGVATGANDLEEIRASGFADQSYPDFRLRP